MRLLPKTLPGVVAVLLTVAGCVSTQLDSLPTPQGHPLPLRRILVLVNFEDIGIRVSAENAATPQAPTGPACDSTSPHALPPPSNDPYDIRNRGRVVVTQGATVCLPSRFTLFLPSYRYLPPLEQWQQMTASEKDSLLASDSVDAVMVVEPRGAGTTETVYGSSTTKCTSVDMANGACRSTRTTGTAGTISKPWLNTSVRVFAVGARTILWSATTKSGGGAFTGYGNLASSVVGRAIKRLKSDGLTD